MSRDLRAENASLRVKLRNVETRLHLLATAALTDPDAAQSLAKLLLTASMDADGASQVAAVAPSGEPGARFQNPHGSETHPCL